MRIYDEFTSIFQINTFHSLFLYYERFGRTLRPAWRKSHCQPPAHRAGAAGRRDRAGGGRDGAGRRRARGCRGGRQDRRYH